MVKYFEGWTLWMPTNEDFLEHRSCYALKSSEFRSGGKDPGLWASALSAMQLLEMRSQDLNILRSQGEKANRCNWGFSF